MRAGVVDPQRALAVLQATLAIAWLTAACEPTVVIGTCAQPSSEGGGGDAGSSSTANDDPVGVPWSTGFENGICGFYSEGGYCYARHDAAFEIVSSPVHTGKFAAAFTVTGNATTGSTNERSQARCVRQGVMPKSAYYGAWYWVPAQQTSDGNWNLFHFLGGVSEADSHSLWDISLSNNADGALELSVYDFLNATHPPLSGVPPIPIASWFHIEILIKRSAQPTGEVTVYQDEVVALHLTNVITDDTDWGQWYVGNYARKLVPELSTVYVDDVTIREEP
jgi:hypothetical protein